MPQLYRLTKPLDLISRSPMEVASISSSASPFGSYPHRWMTQFPLPCLPLKLSTAGCPRQEAIHSEVVIDVLTGGQMMSNSSFYRKCHYSLWLDCGCCSCSLWPQCGCFLWQSLGRGWSSLPAWSTTESASRHHGDLTTQCFWNQFCQQSHSIWERSLPPRLEVSHSKWWHHCMPSRPSRSVTTPTTVPSWFTVDLAPFITTPRTGRCGADHQHWRYHHGQNYSGFWPSMVELLEFTTLRLLRWTSQGASDRKEKIQQLCNYLYYRLDSSDGVRNVENTRIVRCYRFYSILLYFILFGKWESSGWRSNYWWYCRFKLKVVFKLKIKRTTKFYFHLEDNGRSLFHSEIPQLGEYPREISPDEWPASLRSPSSLGWNVQPQLEIQVEKCQVEESQVEPFSPWNWPELRAELCR